jgi:O-Antigen ligase
MLGGTVLILPLQNYLPTVGGASVGFILFGVLAGYLVINRLSILCKTLLHPVFLVGYVFVGIGLFMELAHNSSGFSELRRILLMMLGGVFVGSLCRDRPAMLSFMYGLLLASVGLAAFLFLTTYGALSTVKAGDFQSASDARSKVFDENELELDLNTMAFFVAQGVVVAMTLALTAKTNFKKSVFLAITGFCLIATFLPMSRGGLAILVLSCASVLYFYGIMRPKVFFAIVLLALGILLWVPDAVFSRFTFSTETNANHHVEARARVWMEVVNHFSEYFFTGLGISDFYGNWGMNTGFRKGDRVLGTHNCFAQVTIYWGVIGLLSLLLLVFQAYRCLPKKYGQDPLRLCVLGIAISVCLNMFVVHTLYAKEFSIALGMLVGSSNWVWAYRTQ